MRKKGRVRTEGRGVEERTGNNWARVKSLKGRSDGRKEEVEDEK